MTKNYERTLPASGQETENILEARKELIRLNVYQCVDLFEYKEKGYRGQEMHIFQAFVEDGIHHHENNYVGLCKKTTTLLRRIEADEVLSKI